MRCRTREEAVNANETHRARHCIPTGGTSPSRRRRSSASIVVGIVPCSLDDGNIGQVLGWSRWSRSSLSRSGCVARYLQWVTHELRDHHRPAHLPQRRHRQARHRDPARARQQRQLQPVRSSSACSAPAICSSSPVVRTASSGSPTSATPTQVQNLDPRADRSQRAASSASESAPPRRRERSTSPPSSRSSRACCSVARSPRRSSTPRSASCSAASNGVPDSRLRPVQGSSRRTCRRCRAHRFHADDGDTIDRPVHVRELRRERFAGTVDVRWFLPDASAAGDRRPRHAAPRSRPARRGRTHSPPGAARRGRRCSG